MFYKSRLSQVPSLQIGYDYVVDGGKMARGSSLIQFARLVEDGMKSAATKVVVVAQLVDQSLPTPELCGLNPIIGKVLSTKLSINYQ